MLWLPHSNLAVAVTKKLRLEVPWLIFLTSWLMHYLGDAIPHTEPSTFRLLMLGHSEFYWTVAISLFLLDILLIFCWIVLLQKAGVWKSIYWWVLAGAFVPDLLDNTPIITNYLHQFGLFKALSWFHDQAHFNIDAKYWIIGVATQLIVIIGGSWIIIRWKNAKLAR
jgi:hypothetical protein